MGPLFHPAAEDITVEGILHALADPMCVHIFARIARAECSQICSAFLEVSDQKVPKSTLSQHFKVLREAGLIRSERKGVEMHNSPRCDGIDPRFHRLIAAIIDAHKAQTQKEIHLAQQTIGLHVNPSDQIIRLGPLVVRFLLTGDNSAGSIAAFELIVPGAQRLPAPAHSHDHYEETIYGLDGVVTWTVDGKAIDVAPGEALCIPRGAVHRFDNNGSRDAKSLCVITPAAIGPQYFHEVAEVLNAAAGNPPDRAKMAEIMRRHGLTPAPPPPQA